MNKKITYLTVSALNNYIEKKYKHDPYLKEIYVKGEVSNCKLHSNGNLYFTIKDGNTRIDATKFNGHDYKNIKEGDTVYLKAALNFLLGFGQQRLTVHEIKLDSIGDLYKKLIEIRNKLSKEGLFDSKYKKAIPKFNNNIAVVTSSTGAAIEDIKRTIIRRYPLANINIYSSLVQGHQAINDIIKNLKLADEDNNDVILLARGGGSIEDLWSFNSEEVVRAVFSCMTPVVTGVGHETDTTLVDYVSDFRASTPTAAAEIVTPYTFDNIKEHLIFTRKKLNELLRNKISIAKNSIVNLENNYYIKHFSDNYKIKLELLVNYENRISLAVRNKIMLNKNNLEQKIDRYRVINFLNVKREKFNFLIESLEHNSPLNIITKGYSIVYDKNNERVNSIDQLNIDENLTIQIKDGKIKATVNNIVKERIQDGKK